MYLIYLNQQRRYVFNYAYLDPKWKNYMYSNLINGAYTNYSQYNKLSFVSNKIKINLAVYILTVQ